MTEPFDPAIGEMSNYSIYFLRQNAHLNTNCSVYSLTSGSIQYQDFDTSEWSGNVSSFLPAYYVTNCSIPELWRQIASQNVSQSDMASWLEEYRENPYNNSDNGDSFVALLFMLVGSCVSCWMLSLLFLLSPKHKRKPVLTQLAVLCFSVYLTLVLSKVAVITEDEYYADSLDMVRIYSAMYDRQYAVVALVSFVLTQFAYFELFWRMTRQRWKVPNGAIVASLIVAGIVAGACMFRPMQDLTTYVTRPLALPGVVFSCFEIVFMLWFSLTLAHYTVYGTATPPKQVAYSRKLLPMAVLTWLLIGTYLVIALLLLTYWRSMWLISSWLYLVPKLLSKYILTAGWEWYDSIRHLESQLEIVDMLGRRISLEDVMDFATDDKVKRTALRGRFAPLLDLVHRRRRRPHPTTATFDDSRSRDAFSATTSATSASVSVSPSTVVVDCGTADNHPHIRPSIESSEYEVQYMNSDSFEGAHHDYSERMGANAFAGENSPESSAAAAGPVEGSSNAHNNSNFINTSEPADELPPFRPHPGFTRDDYWDEK